MGKEKRKRNTDWISLLNTYRKQIYEKKNTIKLRHKTASNTIPILILAHIRSIPNHPGRPSLARSARHLRLFTMPDQDHPSPSPSYHAVRHHTAAAFPIRARPYQKNPIPLPPFLFLPQDITITANHKNNTFHCRHAPSAINAVELI